MLAPIVLFVYNRCSCLIETIESLQENELADKSNLYVFSDGAKDKNHQKAVLKVRKYLKTIDGFAKVELIERSKNYGLAKNIISGVSQIVRKYEKIIVLEDDLVTGKYFLKFMNDALQLYEKNTDVISINGYSYFNSKDSENTYFLKTADNLGWGTWKDGWSIFDDNGERLLSRIKKEKVEYLFDRKHSYPFLQMLKDQIDGVNDSWAIRWYASAFLENKYTLYPYRSLVYHIGASDVATNYKLRKNDPLDVELYQKQINVGSIKVTEQKINGEQYNKFLLKYKIPFYKKVYPKLKSVFRKINY